jgi:PhnB protein
MAKRSLKPGDQFYQLNKAIDSMLAGSGTFNVDAGIEPLVRLARELLDLPRKEFKTRLKDELLKSELLEEKTTMLPVAEPATAARAGALPHITLKDTARAIEFYQKALGATETFRFEVGGHIPHAEIKISGTVFGLADEWVEGGRLSAETLGGSPVGFRIFVDDVDSFAARAVAAGMKVSAPIVDQFYGYREGNFVDPFGYTWNIATVKEEMSVEEMHRRLNAQQNDALQTEAPKSGEPAAQGIREGFHTVTPYLVAQDAEGLIEFVKKTFGAEETFRDIGSAGGYHCEVRIDDSMLMIGGGGPGLAWKGDAVLGAFHVYVRDCDAAYRRALEAGAKSLTLPTEQPYGERTAGVIDAAGNYWYIATYRDSGYKSEGAPAVQPYLHPLRVDPVFNFLKRAFGAQELGRYTSPEGVVEHTTLEIGTSHLEMGEAQGPYQPMKSMFYLYVPNADAVYRAAITAGAVSVHEPKDQPYGDRVGAVKDIFGNEWFISTHLGQGIK